MTTRSAARIIGFFLVCLSAGCAGHPAPPTGPTIPLSSVVPIPVSVKPADGVFQLCKNARISVDSDSKEILGVGNYLAQRLRPATGFALPVVASGKGEKGGIRLTVAGASASMGREGYQIEVTSDDVTVVAAAPEGLFRGVQTIRQLLPPDIERQSAQPGPWLIATGTIVDRPRFAWRGAMLDVARHFFGVDDVKRFIDDMALYKLNRLHIHLTDDQGWRIAISSWPSLTDVGGRSAVAGDPGGYYTQAQFQDIVSYAHSRYITVVPEVDMPGHVNAALCSVPQLNASGSPTSPYTGVLTGFSALQVASDVTYAFVDNVIGEVASVTSGPYLHVGGDEAQTLSASDYVAFVSRIGPIVAGHGKTPVGWADVGQAAISSNWIVQHWAGGAVRQAVKKGATVIMSPADKAYLDMKYDAATPLGTVWAGYIGVRKAYEWDPATEVDCVPEACIIGVEAPLWTETLRTMEQLEYMAFPRLIGLAEIGWSPQSERNWDGYSTRLARQAPRLEAMGVTYYASPEVPWTR